MDDQLFPCCLARRAAVEISADHRRSFYLRRGLRWPDWIDGPAPIIFDRGLAWNTPLCRDELFLDSSVRMFDVWTLQVLLLTEYTPEYV